MGPRRQPGRYSAGVSARGRGRAGRHQMVGPPLASYHTAWRTPGASIARPGPWSGHAATCHWLKAARSAVPAGFRPAARHTRGHGCCRHRAAEKRGYAAIRRSRQRGAAALATRVISSRLQLVKPLPNRLSRAVKGEARQRACRQLLPRRCRGRRSCRHDIAVAEQIGEVSRSRAWPARCRGSP